MIQLPQLVEVKGIRVLTSKQLAEEYGTTTDVIKKNFSNNRERFMEGKHYISFSGDELKEFKNQVKNVHLVDKRTSHLYLWTEKGALFHAKSLNTDKAWEVYDYLVDFYFRAKEETLKKKPTSQIPVVRSKSNTRLVVDIPESVKAQQIIKEIKQCLGAIEILIGESNRYLEVKEFKDVRVSAGDALIALVSRMRDYQVLEPKLIEKVY